MPKSRRDTKNMKAQFSGLAIKGLDAYTLKQKKCLLLVSIKDNEHCTGDYFAASIRSALETFGEVTVLIVDKPHWHNLSLIHPEYKQDRLEQLAIDTGDTWFKANRGCLIDLVDKEKITDLDTLPISKQISRINKMAEKNKIKMEILRWDNWARRTGAIEDKEHVLQNYQDNTDIKQALNDSAEIYAKRKGGNHKRVQSSINYLNQEGGGIAWGVHQEHYDVIAYAGSIPTALKVWHSKVTQSLDPWLEISFKNNTPKKEVYVFDSPSAFFSQKFGTPTPSETKNGTVNQVCLAFLTFLTKDTNGKLNQEKIDQFANFATKMLESNKATPYQICLAFQTFITQDTNGKLDQEKIDLYADFAAKIIPSNKATAEEEYIDLEQIKSLAC